MPIYVYRCPNCGQQFDKMQSFSADNVYPCPNCHAEAKRQIQPAGLIFKGSGWYITDSRKEDAARANKAAPKDAGAATETEASSKDTASPAASAESTTPATESKPATDTAAAINPTTPAA